MMNGVTFDGRHCLRDFGWLLKNYIIGEAKPRSEILPVPGSSFGLDYTEFFGGVDYEPRKLEIQLKIIADKTQQAQKYSVLQNAVSGVLGKIAFEDDPGWYWSGRATVGKLEHGAEGQTGYTTVTAVCYPYKKRVAETIVTQGITTAWKEITLSNDQEKQVPSITATTACEISFGSVTHSVPPGDILLADLQLQPGGNIVRVKAKAGTGNITFRWRGGSL